MRLHWHRRDLRATDNAGLVAAAADGPVVPVFVFDRDVLAHAGPPRVAFMLDALDSLRSWYRDRGSDLVVRCGDPRDILPALATEFETIGIREVHEAVVEARASAAGADYESAEEFESQLAWREFYSHVLWDRPDVVTQNYRSYERPVEWREDPEGLQVWKDGETGYPIVDAGMRQLREEAFMHNHVRMIVASFLTKDLMIDWRAGYDWFREKLVDHAEHREEAIAMFEAARGK